FSGLLLCFFFYGSVPPRLSLSFPTRRSSDLSTSSTTRSRRPWPINPSILRPLPTRASGATGTTTSVIIARAATSPGLPTTSVARSEEHTSELQSLAYLVCRLLLEKKNHTHET